MNKVIINSYADFEKLVGQQIGVSDYLEVPQEVKMFAACQKSGFTTFLTSWLPLRREFFPV